MNCEIRDKVAAWLALACLGLFAFAASAADFDVRSFGAIGDGKAKDTAAVQRALDACAQAGVEIPPESPGRKPDFVLERSEQVHDFFVGAPNDVQRLWKGRKFYKNAPDGLCGNEDHGEMSAWYVFACLGFYPVNPASGDFVIGAPQLSKVTLNVGEGRRFTVVARNLSEKNLYVKSVTLNGKPLDGFILRYCDIVAGGELVFEMSDKGIRAY